MMNSSMNVAVHSSINSVGNKSIDKRRRSVGLNGL